MSIDNHVPINISETSDFKNEAKEQSDLNSPNNLINNKSSLENGKTIESGTLGEESLSTYKKTELNSSEVINNDNLSENDKDDNCTQEFSSKENCLGSKILSADSLDDQTEDSIKDESSLDDHISDTGNGLQKPNENENDVNVKDTENNLKDTSCSIESPITPMQSSENGRENLHSNFISENSDSGEMESQLKKEHSDLTKFDSESTSLQKCNDTQTKDLLVNKRKREEFEDETLVKKHLKIESEVQEEKSPEMSNVKSGNISEQTTDIKSDELDEIENEIFENDGEISETQDEDVPMKDLTIQASENLSHQNEEMETENTHNKETEDENQIDALKNKSESFSSKVNENLEDEDFSEKETKTEDSLPISSSVKCLIESKKVESESVKEVNGINIKAAENDIENKKDSKPNSSQENNVDTSNETKSKSERDSIKETIENNLVDKKCLETGSERIEVDTEKDEENSNNIPESEGDNIKGTLENNLVDKKCLETGSERILETGSERMEVDTENDEENSNNISESEGDNIKETLENNLVDKKCVETNSERKEVDAEKDEENSNNSSEEKSENGLSSESTASKNTQEKLVKVSEEKEENIKKSEDEVKGDSGDLVQSRENEKAEISSKNHTTEASEVNEETVSKKNIDKSEGEIENDSENSVQSSEKLSTKDDGENTGDIIIGEAFTINEEEMKAMESASEDESKKSESSKSETSEKKLRGDTASTSSSVTSSVSRVNRNKPSTSAKRSSSKSGKKHKRTFSLSKRKKKLSSQKTSAVQYVPPMRLELELPSFLEELAVISPSLNVLRERYNEDGKKVKVQCIVFHETVLNWAMTETFLSAMDNAKALRSRLKVKDRSHLFPENTDSKLNEIHPVMIGEMFPFAMRRMDVQESPSNKEEVPLPFPLEQLCSLCPSVSGYRTAGQGEKFNLKSVTFAAEPLEWAFKETFLSSFSDSPILSNIFELDSSSKCWPDFADIILTHEGVDYTFPFACPNSKKYFENFFFGTLSTEIPAALRHETLELPPIRSDLEKDLYTERDALIRLLAVASFYKHSSCIPTVRTNKKLSPGHASLVSSFRPLIISQANRTGVILRKIRANLLKDVTCQDPSIIPSMINGPLHCKRGIIFSHLQRLELAVSKDPNNKLQNI